MTDYRTVTACRLCDSSKLSTALDLGETPLANELYPSSEALKGAAGGRGAKGICPKCMGPCFIRQSDKFDDPEQREVMCFPCGVRWHVGPVGHYGECLPLEQQLFPLIVNRCDDCGHHQLSIAVAPERLWGPSYPYQSGTSPVFRKHLEALADEVAALKPGGRVLEIASNDGTLVKALAARGCRVKGVDPSGKDDAGDGWLTLAGNWPPVERVAECWGGTQDCILALNVFAHVDDLHSFTAAVKEALAPDGVFIVEVGYLPEQIKRGQFDTIYAEHLSYHSAKPLGPFFSRHGLGIHNWKMVESQGGSIRLYVKHAGPDTHPPPLEIEPNITSLRPLIDARAAALHEVMSKLTKRGETVAIYGAPAKLTTLLYATGLDKLPFACVGDDNPRKVGRTTPGNHIPIVSVEDMLARKPDTILVASWNFFDNIRDRLRAAGFKGGIINPMGSQ